jgi:hypothetical protein
MKIINNQNYYTDKQLLKVVKLLGKKYEPSKLIIVENRLNLISTLIHCDFMLAMYQLFNVPIWLGKIEGIYNELSDVAIVYIFSENDDGDDLQSKQLYSLHALTHELRHRWQKQTNYKGDVEKDADNFATEFINKKSATISNIMNWEDEWEVEEE